LDATKYLHWFVERLPLSAATVYWRLSEWRHRSIHGQDKLGSQAKLLERLIPPYKVLAGPFMGMAYLRRTPGSTLAPKILGSYEIEITDYIAQLVAHPFRQFIDIGSAEGYYAVGFAWRNPIIRVACFEMDAMRRHQLRRMARMNGVDSRVEILPKCSQETFRTALANDSGPTLILCDCEGGEDALLEPAAVPQLADAWLVVETHDFVLPGVSDRLRTRFEETHTVETIVSRPRTIRDAPTLGWSETDLLTAMDECRPSPQSWLVMTPRDTRS
jgi:hypothetical protein